MIGIIGPFAVSKLRRPRTPLPVYGTVPAFALTNQFGQLISSRELLGNVWVADIIFTRCPGPCIKMTGQMRDLQASLPAEEPVRLVSLTADPVFDTPQVLKRYGERFGAVGGRWHFLTGNKPDLYRLATRGLLLALEELQPEKRESENDLFVHSTLFVVVDKQGRIRATRDGAEPSSLPKILEAVRVLLEEKQP